MRLRAPHMPLDGAVFTQIDCQVPSGRGPVGGKPPPRIDVIAPVALRGGASRCSILQERRGVRRGPEAARQSVPGGLRSGPAAPHL